MIILGLILGAMILGAAQAIFGGFLIMLIVGGLHSEVFPQLPAWSLRQSILVGIALVIFGSYFKTYSSSKS